MKGKQRRLTHRQQGGWRDFGAANTAGTCLWCGSKIGDRNPTGRTSEHFCTLRCSCQFGSSMAELGYKLVDDCIPVADDNDNKGGT